MPNYYVNGSISFNQCMHIHSRHRTFLSVKKNSFVLFPVQFLPPLKLAADTDLMISNNDLMILLS